MSLIGLDIGTTGCKAIVFSEAGEVLGRAAREYPIHTPRPHWAEQDAELVWQQAWASCPEAQAWAVHLNRRVEPDPASVSAYDRRFQLYQQIYPLLREFNHALS